MTVIALGRRATRLEIDRKRERDIAALDGITTAELHAEIRRRLMAIDPALADQWDAANAQAAAQSLSIEQDPCWFRKPYIDVAKVWAEIWAEARAKLAAMESAK